MNQSLLIVWIEAGLSAVCSDPDIKLNTYAQANIKGFLDCLKQWGHIHDSAILFNGMEMCVLVQPDKTTNLYIWAFNVESIPRELRREHPVVPFHATTH